MDVGKTLARLIAGFPTYLGRLVGHQDWEGRWRVVAAIALPFVLLGSLWLILASPLVSSAEREGDLAAEPRDASSGVRDDLEAFERLSDAEGWLQSAGRLYRTDDGGQAWRDITPRAGPAEVKVAHFLDGKRAWAVVTSDGAAYSLARTSDGGQTWAIESLKLAALGSSALPAQPTYVQFVDPSHGWLVVKRMTSNNFSLGTLYATDDGGKTWSERTIPIAEPVYFASPKLGWVAGGAAGDELYRTRDGGQTWEAQKVVATTGDQTVYYRLPRVDASGKGVLPVVVSSGDDSQVKVYATGNGGDRWEAAEGVDVGQQPNGGRYLPLVAVDAGRWVALEPSGRSVSRGSESGKPTTARAQGDTLAGIVELSMASAEVGWARHKVGTCRSVDPSNADSAIECTTTTRLVATSDGGTTWSALSLPAAPDALSAAPDALSALTGTSVAITGQAFDTCEIPSLTSLQAWVTSSPYRTVNIYFGGSSRACLNTRLTASYVSSISAQGWRFIPTWVGPQAPCFTGTKRKISYDPNEAYGQGVAEANAASDRLAELGFPVGTVAYYDLEAYDTGNATCRTAVKSFMTGWTTQMHSRSNVSGLYGAGCASGMTDFVRTSAEPDQVWLAWWSYSTYTPNVSLGGVPCVSDNYWPNHHRLRQYAGDHYETWGGVRLNIDSDILDGSVADLCGGTIACKDGPPQLSSPASGYSATVGQSIEFTWSAIAGYTSYRFEAWNESVSGISQAADATGTSYSFAPTTPGYWRWQVRVIQPDGTLGPLSTSRRFVVQWPASGFDLPRESKDSLQWFAEYWPNKDMSGDPVAKKNEGTGSLDKDWGSGSPGYGLPSDLFSARFERTVYFPCGLYRFGVTQDDGARVLIDGTAVPALDHWAPNNASFTADVRLAQGTHVLKVLYYEQTGSAHVSLDWALVSACPNSPSVPSPSAGQSDVSLSQSLSWVGGDPEGEVVTYSVYMDPLPSGQTGPISPETKVCQGTTTTCDPLPGKAPDGSELELSPLTHYYWQVEAVDSAGNTTMGPLLDFVTSGCSNGQYRAEYSRGSWPGTSYLVRCESPELGSGTGALASSSLYSRDWGTGGPGLVTPWTSGSLGTDNYSLALEGTFDFPSSLEADPEHPSLYGFFATSDEGVRVYLDGVQVLDGWEDQAPTNHRGSRVVTPGEHVVRVEYYQGTGSAQLKVGWSGLAACEGLATGELCAQYFPNTSLQGMPSLANREALTTSAYLLHEWGVGAPAGLPSDNFSAVYEGKVLLEDGSYRLTATSDDGVRLYLDGELVLSGWNDQDPTTYQTVKSVTAGEHDVRIESYHATGSAALFASIYPWTDPCASPAVGEYCAEYFNGSFDAVSAIVGLQGAPVLARKESAPLSYDWGIGSPDPLVDAESFGARWTGRFPFEYATYTFTVTAGDGIRLWVDGSLLIDQWKPQAPTTYTAMKAMTAGEHEVRIEYFGATQAAAAKVAFVKFVDPCSDQVVGEYCAKYYNGSFSSVTASTGISSTPVFLRKEASPLSYDWGSGSPDALVNADSFGAKWTGRFPFEAASYTFSVTADDGVRLWVDGSPLIDRWNSQGPTTYTATKAMTAGEHDVRVEYFEATGGAVLKASWAKAAATRPEVIVDDKSSGFTKGGSYWRESTTGYLSHSWWTYVYGNKLDSWGEWRANLSGGSYEVFAYVPSANNSTVKAKYTVYYQGGSLVRTVSQSANGGKWVSLGTYTFASGTTRQVRLTDTTGETANSKKIAFDAVRFTPRSLSATCYALSTSVSPSASGSVEASPAVNCTDGSSRYTPGTVVTLTAKANSGYTFVSWSGSASGTTNPTTVTLSVDRSVTASFSATGDPCAGLTTGQYCARYFANQTLTGSPLYTTKDSSPISHDWGTGGPGHGIPNDHFSARFEGTFSFATAGTYTFTSTSDDGIRVFVDGGTALIDKWIDQGPTTYTGSKALTAGTHTVRVEYYENTGGAVAKLSWALQTGRAEVIVDDKASGFTKGGSYWKDVAAGYLSHFYATTTNGSVVDSWGEWRANLAGGSYEVFVYVPASNSYTTAANSTLKAKYTVYYSGGSVVKTVSQSANMGKWVSLGTYTFAAGTTRQVRLTDATGEAVNAKRLAFDAVRFTPR